MEGFIWALLIVGGWLLYQRLKSSIAEVRQRLTLREAEYAKLAATVERLRQELLELRIATPPQPETRPVPLVRPPVSAPVTQVAPAAPPQPVERPPVTAPQPMPDALPVALPVVPPATAPAPPVAPPVSTPSILPAPAPSLPVPPAPATPTPVLPAPVPVQPVPVAAVLPTPAMPAPPPPAAVPEPARIPVPMTPPPPMHRPKPKPAEPVGPTWWQRTEQLVLENWTGILGAVVLVTGVGFLGIYTALRVSPEVRFLMICAFAAALLGAHYYLRAKPFAVKLNVWLQSSAAAIFLFACVGAVSVPGLQWAGPPLNYILLLLGVAANLWLAWSASRETVATLHGVLSLVALAVISPILITLGAAAGVTAFSIGITYRNRWKYQLLLSIASFFAFHQFWYYHLTVPASGATRLVAMALVVLVGGAAAVVQYRRVYARQQFDPLLFSAHVLNWTCLGINLFHYSTGSPWKTVPLALGALLTFGVARQARRLGIQWLFQTDTIISLILALATAFSLLGWHATGPFVLLFMLFETLLVAFIMAREREELVFRVASTGAVLASILLLGIVGVSLPDYQAVELHRNALLLWLAGATGAVYFQLVSRQALLTDSGEDLMTRQLYNGFGGMVGALFVGSAGLLLYALFGLPHPPVVALVGTTAAAGGGVFALAWWLRTGSPRFRTMHLLVGQVFLTVAILGLHKAGLVWPATFAVLYLESLVMTWLLARRPELPASQFIWGSALFGGAWLVMASLGEFSTPLVSIVGRNAALLIAAGTLSAAFFRQLAQFKFVEEAPGSSSIRQLLTATGSLTALFYLCGAGLLLQGLFGLSQPPVAALVGGAALAAGIVFGLAWWLRTGSPWFRTMHLLVGQVFIAVAILGLHKAGLSWPTTFAALYLESLMLTWLLARRPELPAGQFIWGSALFSGAWLVMASLGEFSTSLASTLGRDAALLVGAGALSAVFFQQLAGLGFVAKSPMYSSPRQLLTATGSLAGLFYLCGAGLLLQALFGLSHPPVTALVSGAALAAGVVFGLAWWLRSGAPWFRALHLLAGQVLLASAILGLHEAGLSWALTITLLYLEMLALSWLLAWGAERWVYRVLVYGTLLMAVVLPLVVYHTSPALLSAERRALLLTLAALATIATQALLHRRQSPAYDAIRLFSPNPAYQLRLLSLMAGVLLLAAGGLVYQHTWAAWVAAGLGAALLALRRYLPVPGLWLGLLLASVGYHLLQWSYVQHPADAGGSLAVLAYLIPLLGLAAAGLAYSWRQAWEQQERWPWLYLGSLHAAVLAWAVVPPPASAVPLLLWLALVAGAAAAAQVIRRRLPEANLLHRAGFPDRYLLHVTFTLLGWALLWHFGRVLHGTEHLLGFPARHWTAAGLLLVLGALAWQRPPATQPHYRTWRYLQPLLWILLALALQQAGQRLPARLRRTQIYSLLFFWAATISSIYVSVAYLSPGHLISPNWLVNAGAVALLFGFTALAIPQARAVADAAEWPAPLSGLAALAMLQRRPRQLVVALLYPAFVALTVLLVQSFDRSILTVLLMLEVVGVFVSSLLLRRQDLRYVALAGILICFARLVFFDLRQSSTISRAIVFILMGLLLLGVNALYARFKDRFSPEPDPGDAAKTVPQAPEEEAAG